MNTKFFRAALVSLAAIAPVVACAPTAPAADQDRTRADTVELAIGNPVTTSAGVVLEVLGVPADSRCATDVVCVWAGNAKVVLRTVVGDVESGLELNTNPGAPTGPGSVVVGGFRITLLRVSPEPLSDRPIPAEEYRAELEVAPE